MLASWSVERESFYRGWWTERKQTSLGELTRDEKRSVVEGERKGRTRRR